ncbi:MAG TPA: GAF domain-containing protein, partial [Planctomycetota bacterium]|nr:GAF domain-containing protein [Planctomycetota bacterium]
MPEQGYDVDLPVMVPTTGATHGSHESVLGLVQRIAEHHTVSDLLDELVRGLNTAAGTDLVSLHLHDPTTGAMQPYLLGGPVNEAGEVFRRLVGEMPPDESPLTQVLLTQETVVIPDLAAEPRLARFGDLIQLFPARSVTMIPLTTARQRLGVIAFLRHRRGEPSAADVALYATVAKHVALAVEGARHLERAEALAKTLTSERDRLQALVDVNKAIVSELELSKLVAAIGQALQRAVPHDYTVLVLHDPEIDGFRLHALVKPPDRELPIGLGSSAPMNSPWGAAFTSGE